MTELVDAVLEYTPVCSDYGNLPADDTEVNGEDVAGAEPTVLHERMAWRKAGTAMAVPPVHY